jgi:hypothetical protein
MRRLHFRITTAVSIALLLGSSAHAQKKPVSTVAPFIFENGRAGQMSFKDGLLRISKGSGWIRTRQLASNFVLTTKGDHQQGRVPAAPTIA